jgi:DNA-binding MarR family transcriptional regulator
MHFAAFAFKRAHRASLALVRPWLKGTPITPARYDILHVVQSSTVHQAELCRALGLSSATISRALKRLEDLGLVIRTRYHLDRRCKILQLTALGLLEFRRVLYEIVMPDTLSFEYELAIGTPRYNAPQRVRDLYRELRKMARFFGDTAYLRYPLRIHNDPVRAA